MSKISLKADEKKTLRSGDFSWRYWWSSVDRANRLNTESSLSEKREHLSSLLFRKFVSHSSRETQREDKKLVGELKHTKVNTLKRTLAHARTAHETTRTRTQRLFTVFAALSKKMHIVPGKFRKRIWFGATPYIQMRYLKNKLLFLRLEVKRCTASFCP